MKIEAMERFLKSIYLGDRACKGYLLDSWQREFKIRIDEISRVSGVDGQWNYYNDENIENGTITFAGVSSISFKSPGPLPNDYIEITGVEQIHDARDCFLFRIELGCVGEDAETTAMNVEIIATDVYLEAPNLPGIKIR
jgi:hypothetical protein